MRTIDLTRERKQSSIDRAVHDYGERLRKPKYHAFARLIADGAQGYEAYQKAVSPTAAKSGAKSRASILLAHPDMAGMIRDQAMGGRNLAQAVVPEAVRELWDLAATATKETKPRIDALNSVLDRGGLPRAKEIAVQVEAVAWDAMERIESIDGDVIDLEPPDIGPDDLPAIESGREALPAGVDELDAARAAWHDVMSPAALRDVGRRQPPDADALDREIQALGSAPASDETEPDPATFDVDAWLDRDR